MWTGWSGGQYADVSPDTPDGPAALRRLHELKTGRLIDASVICVLLLGGIDGPATICFRRFAAELGVLFQIVDDILDVTGTDDALGKPRGSDERHGKRTYVSEFGMRTGTSSWRRSRTGRRGRRSRRPRAPAQAHGTPERSSSRSPTSSTPAPHDMSREPSDDHSDNLNGTRRPDEDTGEPAAVARAAPTGLLGTI